MSLLSLSELDAAYHAAQDVVDPLAQLVTVLTQPVQNSRRYLDSVKGDLTEMLDAYKRYASFSPAFDVAASLYTAPLDVQGVWVRSYHEASFLVGSAVLYAGARVLDPDGDVDFDYRDDEFAWGKATPEMVTAIADAVCLREHKPFRELDDRSADWLAVAIEQEHARAARLLLSMEPPEDGGGEPDGEEGRFAFQSNDLWILAELAKIPGQTMTQATLGARLTKSRHRMGINSLGERLAALRAANYVDRPRGERGGDAITREGLAACQRIADSVD